MTRIVAVLLFAGATLCGGCADELEQQTVNEVPARLQRGVSGQGRLGQLDRSDDPYVKAGNSQGQ